MRKYLCVSGKLIELGRRPCAPVKQKNDTERPYSECLCCFHYFFFALKCGSLRP